MKLKQPKTMVDNLMIMGADNAMSGSYPPDVCDEIRAEADGLRVRSIQYLKELNRHVRAQEKETQRLRKVVADQHHDLTED